MVLEECLREIRKLRTVFRTAQVDPMLLRRNLRRSQPERRFQLDESERLRRTPEAKRVFADAEHFAELTVGRAYQGHILTYNIWVIAFIRFNSVASCASLRSYRRIAMTTLP